MVGIEVDMVFTVMAGEQMAFRVVLIHCGAVAQLDLGKGHRIQRDRDGILPRNACLWFGRVASSLSG